MTQMLLFLLFLFLFIFPFFLFIILSLFSFLCWHFKRNAISVSAILGGKSKYTKKKRTRQKMNETHSVCIWMTGWHNMSKNSMNNLRWKLCVKKSNNNSHDVQMERSVCVWFFLLLLPSFGCHNVRRTLSEAKHKQDILWARKNYSKLNNNEQNIKDKETAEHRERCRWIARRQSVCMLVLDFIVEFFLFLALIVYKCTQHHSTKHEFLCVQWDFFISLPLPRFMYA